jgi:hypothetical protein
MSDNLEISAFLGEDFLYALLIELKIRLECDEVQEHPAGHSGLLIREEGRSFPQISGFVKREKTSKKILCYTLEDLKDSLLKEYKLNPNLFLMRLEDVPFSLTGEGPLNAAIGKARLTVGI